MNSFICQVNCLTEKKFIEQSERKKYINDGGYTLIWNGGIYNANELKNRAKKLGFNDPSASLEQLMIFLFIKCGTNLFTYLRGKFAIVIWDGNSETLYGARDHFGIESLYYVEHTNNFYVTNFKSYLENVIGSNVNINKHALQHYFTFQYVPEPLTLMNDCFKLPPGHYIMKQVNEPMKKFAYFTPKIAPHKDCREQKIKDIREIIFESVSERMPSKGKVGTFLSGGIDSTLITSFAKQLNPDIKTFTIAFSESGYSEMELAKRTVEALQLDHKEIIVTPEKYIQALLAMIYYLEDPLADPSAVPLYIGCQEAKQDVDILLSGEGADEMFGGYEVYREHESLKVFQYMPLALREPMLKLANRLPKGMKGKSFLYRGLTPLKDRYVGNAKIFDEREKEQLLKFYNPNHSSEQWLGNHYKQVDNNHPTEQMQYIDWHTWLPGDILFKANRLSQATGICMRLPFVDRNIYDIAKHLTIDEKVANKMTKKLLREAAQGIVPDHILYERKRGFPVPLKKWLRNELYVWANRNITNAKTTEYINKDYAIKLLDEHSSGKHDHSRKLWTIIIFNLWYEMFIVETNLFEEPWHISVN